MTLIDDRCDGCGGRFDPMGDPLLHKRPELGPYHVFCPTCEQERRRQTGYHGTAIERLTDSVSALLDQRHRLRTALADAEAERDEYERRWEEDAVPAFATLRAAEAKIARVEALAGEWERKNAALTFVHNVIDPRLNDLRTALDAPAPDDGHRAPDGQGRGE